jgi:hypothetical protein
MLADFTHGSPMHAPPGQTKVDDVADEMRCVRSSGAGSTSTTRPSATTGTRYPRWSWRSSSRGIRLGSKR